MTYAATNSDGSHAASSPTKLQPLAHHAPTLVVLCLLSALEGADMQILPSSFRAMEVDLELKPYYLGVLSLCQGVACAFSGPFWGNLVDCGISRILLITIGVSTWGICTLSLGMVTHFGGMAFLRAMNGAAVACLLPISQSIVSEITHGDSRGRVFGWLYLCSKIGEVCVCLFVTPLSNMQIFGMGGWRVALLFVGLASLLIAPLVPVIATEAPREWRPERCGPSVEIKKLWKFVQIKTFLVVLLQGVFGTIPGAALAFVTMYLQYTGVTDAVAAMINALHIIGVALGGLLGGAVGDYLHSRSPRYGRAVTAQLSVLASIPCVTGLFLLKPTEENITAMTGMMFLHGLVGSWVTPGCLAPVMCDIIPKSHTASAYAWELAIVFASGNALGPLTVGYLSQRVYGYSITDEQVVDMSPTLRERNAEALGASLLVACIIPYFICAVIFTTMYITYPGDVIRDDRTYNDASSYVLPANSALDMARERRRTTSRDGAANGAAATAAATEETSLLPASH
mmetsp:Transcript_93375/g.194823  ORF Transcript_93375/g.194823 Transcript_93375/m.194823 type:complete len:513 (-) Transcript_93375:158-1696(-)|eukprot:CAMPEP_0206438336 /NCGR_PEP_ID=MMETSP0324_2-20121206/11573_1 /ASSEMBLY_ACC=CAM_ASM_000836 /TAXON_ID=2866 /ORGANISM="Crypthecodinium cohnii, Strain Seligo" /LENGTH=512 /DNA_ID=CAMNT_0053905783 /DNA_START=323 /DNA_END=1861 /DNA_ORIENTATION=-